MARKGRGKVKAWKHASVIRVNSGGVQTTNNAVIDTVEYT